MHLRIIQEGSQRFVWTCVLLLCCGMLAAAEPMERPAETQQVWASQQDEVAAAQDAAPVISGMLVWSGRADRNYQPFFQWEIQVQAGTEDLRDLRLRVIPLRPDLTPLYSRESHWRRLGRLSAGERTDLSYFLNTSIFPAYRVEMQWSGGSASYLAHDRTSIPQREGESDNLPQLTVIDPIWDRNARGQAMVGFWLRNHGGGDATGVQLTLRLRDGEGQVLLEHPYVPENGSIPAGYAKEQRVLIQRTPPFHNIQIGITSDEVTTMRIDGGSLGDGEAVEVGEISVQDGVLRGKLRNGSAEAISDVLIDVHFVNAEHSPVATVQAQVQHVSAGETTSWELQLPEDLPEWSGFDTSLAYASAESQADSSIADESGQAIAVMTVEGLTFSILNTNAGDGLLKVSGELHNQRDQNLQGLVVSFSLPGLSQDIEARVGDLAVGETFSLSFVAEGIEALSGIGFSWRSGGE